MNLCSVICIIHSVHVSQTLRTQDVTKLNSDQQAAHLAVTYPITLDLIFLLSHPNNAYRKAQPYSKIYPRDNSTVNNRIPCENSSGHYLQHVHTIKYFLALSPVTIGMIWGMDCGTLNFNMDYLC